MAASSATRRIDPLLSGAEVAELLGVTTRTVRQLAANGELHRIVLGHRTTRYRAEDVATFIDRSTTSNGGPVKAAAAKGVDGTRDGL
jgi:excisionase family DNA binding protein